MMRANFELRHRRGHDREPAGQHRRALGLEARELQVVDMCPRAIMRLRSRARPSRRDAAFRPAVLLEDVGERERGARRRVGVGPVRAAELARDRLDLGARVRLGGVERGRGQRAVGEEARGHADAAELERLEPLGLAGRGR